MGSLNLLYQFWVHTRHLPKLGWLEWVFITPSNHRVHHARNPRYVDKNYGGVFILWDRLFGSFQEELEADPVEFGISKPLASWNPLRANLHIFQKMLRECRRTKNLRDKFYIWIAPTGWQPGDLPPSEPPALSAKYDPACNRRAKLYALGLLLSMYAWGSYYLLNFGDAAFPARALGFTFILVTLLEAGAALENKLSGAAMRLRRACLVLCTLVLGNMVEAPYHYLYLLYGLLLVSAWLSLAQLPGRQPDPASLA